MTEVQLDVREVCQSASGGSYVVKYKASVTITPQDDEVAVSVISTIPPAADPESLHYIVEAVRAGFTDVLSPTDCGARAQLSDVVVHDFDYNPPMQRKHSKEYLDRALKETDLKLS